MKAFLKSINERVWLFVENGWERPTTAISEWTTTQKEAASFNSKAMNVIFNAISMEEFKRISNVEIAHTAWNILQTVHEGTKADQPKVVRKILRSLTEELRPKVTAIIESKDVDSIPADKLVGFLQSYESDLPKTNKSTFMALKSVDDCGFDDELSFIEIAYLAKNFRNFLRNNNRWARNRNNVDTKNVKKNDTAKNNNGYGYLKSECPTFLRSKCKAMATTLSDDEISDHESESDQEGNFMAFIATVVVSEIETADENPFDGELSQNAYLQEAYNKLCKIAAKDAISVESVLKKINILEHEKKNLLLKLFDANELLNSVKIENMSLLENVKSLELE
ncbi:uncharacterized protein LOC136067019 [Quercus suber]|uniref:uncharacterized protein LOC136067019 n=1 Tax=Quercus suber TaxID=58331 RepID=UPI0032DFBE48